LNTEKQSTSNNTQIWIEQGIDSNKNSGWKVLIQPDGADPTHCVFIDKTRNVTIFEEADPNWPSQL
jgi:hypothetical protein